jgi:ABC-type transporter Mla MlaB component
MSGTVDRAGIPALCDRLRAVLERSDADVILCDVGELEDADAVSIDALARLQLTARRLGRRVWLRDACAELEDLLALAGLDEVLPCAGRSGVEPGRQPEQREQARGVEEEADPGDPVP